MTRHDVSNILAATIIPFLFGYVAPIRPTMLLTLQHPHYTVRFFFERVGMKIYETPADNISWYPGPVHS